MFRQGRPATNATAAPTPPICVLITNCLSPAKQSDTLAKTGTGSDDTVLVEELPDNGTDNETAHQDSKPAAKKDPPDTDFRNANQE